MNRKNVLLLGINGSIDIINGIVDFSKDRGWNLMIEDRYAIPEMQMCDGIITTLLNRPNEIRFVRSAIRRGIPVVDINHETSLRGLVRTTLDYSAAGRMAAEHFAERGFRRAAWFSMDAYRMHNLVRTGFEKAWRGEPPLKWTSGNSNDMRMFDKWLTKTLRTAKKPVAVLTFNTYNAFRLLNACISAEIDVPNEIAIISASNETPYLDNVRSFTISYVAFDYSALGYEAARTLELAMSNRLPKSTTLLAPLGIHIGRSSNAYSAHDERLRKALNFMHGNMSHTINAEDIARHVGMSRVSLDRMFVSELGATTGKSILKLRINEVRRMLSDSNMKLDAIASAVGMCHASYLIKVFMREYGITPTQFRRQSKFQNRSVRVARTRP